MCLAVPGKIMSIEGADPMFRTGKVSFGGIIKQDQSRLRARSQDRRLRSRPRRICHQHRLTRRKRRRYLNICGRWENSRSWKKTAVQ